MSKKPYEVYLVYLTHVRMEMERKLISQKDSKNLQGWAKTRTLPHGGEEQVNVGEANYPQSGHVSLETKVTTEDINEIGYFVDVD